MQLLYKLLFDDTALSRQLAEEKLQTQLQAYLKFKHLTPYTTHTSVQPLLYDHFLHFRYFPHFFFPRFMRPLELAAFDPD